MSVSLGVDGERHTFGPVGENPELPAAMWIGKGVLGQDASGGTATITITLPTSDEMPYASVEEIQANTPGADGYIFQLIVSGAFRDGGDVTMARVAQTRGFFQGRQQEYMDGFKAILRNLVGTAGQHRVIVIGANQGAGQNLTVYAWGYIWHRSAQHAKGGPKRPAGIGSGEAAPGGG